MLGSDIHGANLTTIVYGTLYPPKVDTSEDWFESSKIYRESISWDCPGVKTLEDMPEMNTVVQRAGRVYPQYKRLHLPDSAEISPGLKKAIDNRSSAHNFRSTLSVEQLAGLLRYSCGYSSTSDSTLESVVEDPHYAKIHRRVPSAGGLHPLDIMVYARSVRGLDPGIYGYIVSEDSLVRIDSGDSEAMSDATSRALLDAPGASESACLVLIAATFWRTRFKYGHRGMRFVLLEAGHIMQNLLLVAADYEVSARPFGGFIDQEMNALIPGMNGNDTAIIYAAAIG